MLPLCQTPFCGIPLMAISKYHCGAKLQMKTRSEVAKTKRQSCKRHGAKLQKPWGNVEKARDNNQGAKVAKTRGKSSCENAKTQRAKERMDVVMQSGKDVTDTF